MKLYFSFMVKTYYRDVNDGYDDQHEVKGYKSVKLFKSWFKLMVSRQKLLYGFVILADGRKFIWQKPTLVPKIQKTVGGWRKVQSATDVGSRSLELKCEGKEWGI